MEVEQQQDERNRKNYKEMIIAVSLVKSKYKNGALKENTD